jgi:hypothetical protein
MYILLIYTPDVKEHFYFGTTISDNNRNADNADFRGFCKIWR